jgi:protein ImuB
MPVAKAQALAPGLIVMDADHQADAEGLEKLALWALQRISPVVMASLPARPGILPKPNFSSRSISR